MSICWVYSRILYFSHTHLNQNGLTGLKGNTYSIDLICSLAKYIIGIDDVFQRLISVPANPVLNRLLEESCAAVLSMFAVVFDDILRTFALREMKQTHTLTYTSSTAQGGGGSFKNRKPIGDVGCCESRMAERIH